MLTNQYVILAYKMTNRFPRTEIFGMTSQARRASLSVMLNYIEGFARRKKKVVLNFYETSYASLQESIYVFYLSKLQRYIQKEEYMKLFTLKEEIAKMLWVTIEGLDTDMNNDN